MKKKNVLNSTVIELTMDRKMTFTGRCKVMTIFMYTVQVRLQQEQRIFLKESSSVLRE